MLKTFKLRSEDQGIFFSSDWHVFHNKPWVVEDCGYSSIEERANDIRESMNSTVGEDDILFYLGDGFLNSTPEMAIDYMASLRCKNIYYLWGNHESPLGRLYREDMKDVEINELYTLPKPKGFNVREREILPWTLFKIPNVTILGNYQLVFIDSKPVVLSHFPIDVFDHKQYGGFMLTGHSHYNFTKTRKDCKTGKRLDVGWDGHKKILTWSAIKAIMATKQIATEDHHK